MAISKTISAVGSHGYHTFTMTVTESAVNTAANTSTVNVKFTIKPKVSGYNWDGYTSNPPHGTVYFNGSSWSWALPSYNGTSTVTLIDKTVTVSHDADGSKTITGTSSNNQFRFTCSSLSDYYLPGSASNYGSITLTKIARNPSVTQTLKSKTETSITVTWSSDMTIDTIRYSSDNGSSWTSKNVTDGKTGSYTISGLSPNTTYKIKTELHAKTSGLTTQSSALSVKTYNWPYATPTDFNVKNDMAWVTVTNPLGRSGTMKIYAEGVEIFSETGLLESGGYSGLDEGFLDKIPNSMTGSWYVTVTYDGHTTTSASKTYSASGFNPSISSITYADTNSTAQAIIGDDSKILQNVSTPAFTVAASAQYDATIASYSVKILNTTETSASSPVNFGTIGSGTNVTAAVTVTDSRGNTKSQSVTVEMLSYESPSARIALNRQNNYYANTDLTVDASVMSIGSNAPTITAQYSEHGLNTWSDWAGLATLADNTLYTQVLDNTKEWDVKVTVSDSFGGSTAYTGLFVGIGLPILFIDRKKRAVGVGVFPDSNGELATKPIVEGDLDGYQLSDTSLASGTAITNIESFDLPKGVWDVRVVCRFANNSAGRRFMCLSNANNTNAFGWDQQNLPAAPDGYTYAEIRTWIKASAAMTVYINGFQNSGSTLSVRTWYAAVKVGHV